MKFYRIRRQSMITFAIVVFVVGIIAGLNIQQSKPEKIVITEEKVVELGIPAVDSEGNGVVGILVTRIRPGSGQVLVNVNSVLAQFDTQLSGRIAAKAAANFTKTDISGIDVIYDIKVNATIIEGPSAGSTMATAIVLALEGIEAKNIMMTGTITETGGVGRVGSILEKARAAKEEGAEIFLVPEGQGTQLESTRRQSCTTRGRIEVCRVQYDYDKVDIGESLNMTVLEAGTLGEIIEIIRKSRMKETAAV